MEDSSSGFHFLLALFTFLYIYIYILWVLQPHLIVGIWKKISSHLLSLFFKFEKQICPSDQRCEDQMSWCFQECSIVEKTMSFSFPSGEKLRVYLKYSCRSTVTSEGRKCFVSAQFSSMQTFESPITMTALVDLVMPKNTTIMFSP